MTENTMREALLNKFREIIAEQGWQCRDMTEKLVDAAIAHQHQEAVPIYQAANRGQWMDISLQSFIVHTGIKRELYLSPPQPQTVKDALEAAIEIALIYTSDGEHPDDLESAIRALIK